MTSHPKRTSFVNVLGTLGYISVIFQWLWSAVVVGYPLLSSDMDFLIPTPSETQVTQTTFAQPSPITIAVVVIITILIFAFTFYALWKLPAAIGRRGAKATQQAAHALIPVITHHQATSKRERRRLSWRIIAIIKLTLALLPIIALLFAQPIDKLPQEAVWIVAVFCMVCSLIYFGIQQLLVKFWRIDPESAW